MADVIFANRARSSHKSAVLHIAYLAHANGSVFLNVGRPLSIRDAEHAALRISPTSVKFSQDFYPLRRVECVESRLNLNALVKSDAIAPDENILDRDTLATFRASHPRTIPPLPPTQKQKSAPRQRKFVKLFIFAPTRQPRLTRKSLSPALATTDSLEFGKPNAFNELAIAFFVPDR